MSTGLDQLHVLLGEWSGSSTRYSEGRARMSVAPTEDGKFLRVDSRQEGDNRIYQMSVADGVWNIWRDEPGFNQRFIGKIQDGGQTIAGQWEMSRDGKSWEVDFDLTYNKVRG